MSDRLVSPERAPEWRVALTGGIASGKSTVSRMFEELGVPIIDADVIAREVVAPGTALLQQVFERFGDGVRAGDGSLDRAALRQRIFADLPARKRLEGLLQPAIRARSVELASLARGPYLLHVIPLLVETQSAGRFDRVLVVDCPQSLQLQRLQARDGGNLEQATAILSSQATRQQRLSVADDIIVNDGQIERLKAEVAALDGRYRALAAQGMAQ